MKNEHPTNADEEFGGEHDEVDEIHPLNNRVMLTKRILDRGVASVKIRSTV